MRTARKEKTSASVDAACEADWVFICEGRPPRAGYFLAGDSRSGQVAQARWLPKSDKWKFPSAQMAFDVDCWTVLPKAPDRSVI